MHIIPFCVKTALLTTHTAVDISHNSKCCARMLYTRMFTRQFINDSCSTSRVSNTQHNSDIEHVTHLGYQTHWDQNVRRIVQMLNPYFARLNERHNVRIIHNAGFNAGRLRNTGFIREYGTYTQGRFCTGPLQYRKFSTALYDACRNI